MLRYQPTTKLKLIFRCKTSFTSHKFDYWSSGEIKTLIIKVEQAISLRIASVFGCFENGEMGINKNISLLKNDRKIISNYLNTCLGIHFSELKNIKSLKVLNSLLN